MFESLLITQSNKRLDTKVFKCVKIELQFKEHKEM